MLICVNKTNKHNVLCRNLYNWTVERGINIYRCKTYTWRCFRCTAQSVTHTQSDSNCLVLTFPCFYPMRMKQCRCASDVIMNSVTLRYFVPQVPITGKMLNGYPMFSVKNIVQNVKLIELWGKTLAPLHFVISKR